MRFRVGTLSLNELLVLKLLDPQHPTRIYIYFLLEIDEHTLIWLVGIEQTVYIFDLHIVMTSESEL